MRPVIRKQKQFLNNMYLTHLVKNIIMQNMLQVIACQFFLYKTYFCLCKIEVTHTSLGKA